MSIIIINSRNPTPKFISVFSAKNLTVNDASGHTDNVISEKLQQRRGLFLVCRQNNKSALHVSYMFLSPQ